jgi:uncharacterized RDD family membrane protein YckC
VASKGLRFGARVIDATAEATLVLIIWALFGEFARIWTALFLAFLVIWAYEAISVGLMAATPAMRLLGLRIRELDSADPPSWDVSLRRGAMVSVLTNTFVIGWSIWAFTALGDALGRGTPDRISNTIAVPERFAGAVTTRDLPGYADAVRPARISRLGRVGDLDVRLRARLRRLTDAPVLAAAIGLLALASSLPFTTVTIILASGAVWVVLFIANETWLVGKTGATAGHTMAGLVIVSGKTGQPPNGWRSFLRAFVLGTTAYIPLLWPFLWASMLMMRFNETGRGLHDFAGGTYVVADPTLAPEAQRQRAMRMRLGLAG